jgi:hypothetical protein
MKLHGKSGQSEARHRKAKKLKRRKAQVAARSCGAVDENLKRTLAKYRREINEVLDQQAATSEVLRAISSGSGELKPVFEAMLDNAVRICEATFGALFLNENGVFSPQATVGLSPVFSEFLSKRGPFRPRENTTNGYLLRTKKVSHWDAGTEDSAVVNHAWRADAQEG